MASQTLAGVLCWPGRGFKTLFPTTSVCQPGPGPGHAVHLTGDWEISLIGATPLLHPHDSGGQEGFTPPHHNELAGAWPPPLEQGGEEKHQRASLSASVPSF